MQDVLNTVGDQSKCPVALIINQNRVLLGLRHYKPDKWKDVSVWTCPGGRCDEGETIESALRREVKEEIGVHGLSIKEYLGEFKGADEDDLVPVFLCEIDQEPELVEPHKFSEWKWFLKEDFPDNFINRNVEELIRDIL